MVLFGVPPLMLQGLSVVLAADIDALQSSLVIEGLRETIKTLQWVMVGGGAGMAGAILFLVRDSIASKAQTLKEVKEANAALTGLAEKVMDRIERLEDRLGARVKSED